MTPSTKQNKILTPLFSEESDFFEKLSNKKPVLFLDYDGTLTPIVSRPQDAILSQEMKQILNELSHSHTIAVVTGRDMDNVKKLVGLETLIYAGSHGFRISGPNGLYMEHEQSKEILPQLDRIEKELLPLQESFKGVQIDRKRYAVGVHYRNAAEKDEPQIIEAFERVLAQHTGYKKGTGKKIVEIKPDLDWHKGQAVLWILKALKMDQDPTVLPIFIGDDDTDEDAFGILKENNLGLGIFVEHEGQPTSAHYSLKNVGEVGRLFKALIKNRH